MNDPIRSRRFRLLTATVVAAMLLPFRVGAAPRLAVAGAAPAAVRQARALGPLARAQTVSLCLTLPLRDPAGLKDLLHRQSDPGDPAYGQYLTPAQFTARFGPTRADYEAVADYARAQGLTVTGTHTNRLLLDVAGPALAVEAAFGTHLNQYRAADGRLFHAPESAPTVPRILAGRLAGVVGLSDFATRHPYAQERSRAVPQDVGTGPQGGLTPSNIRTAYNLSGSTLTGTGQTLALFELDGYTPSDVTAYESRFGLPSVPLQNIVMDGASGSPGSGADEVTLDIEMQIALAPGASGVLVYETVDTDQGVLDGYGKIADDNVAKSVSTSWGLDEQDNDSAFLQAENTIFAQMAAQGQTIFAAAGDQGAYDSGTVADGLRVDDPASQPYVCGVGGTTLTNTGPGGAYLSETTWNTGSVANGAGGGGVSSLWPIPTWQQGVIGQDAEASSSMRNVPDVSLDADPNTGYAIYYQGGWHVYGGVSCAAPLWSGFAALVNQQRAALGQAPLGQANPALYALTQSGRYGFDFHDIADDSSNLFYHAVAGYDLTTGLGTLNGMNLVADLAPGSAPTAPTVASFPAGLNFLSLPSDYSGIPVADVLGSGPAATLYAWSPTLVQYVLTPASPADAVHLGQGYWARFPYPVTVTAAGTAAATNVPAAISLSNGWNMIGDPFSRGVSVGSLQISSGGQTYTFADAVSAGLIFGILYRYDTGSKAYAPLGSGDTLAPAQGCWIHASGSMTLQVPAP